MSWKPPFEWEDLPSETTSIDAEKLHEYVDSLAKYSEKTLGNETRTVNYLASTEQRTLGIISPREALICEALANPFEVFVPEASKFKGALFKVSNQASNTNLVTITSLGGTIGGPRLARALSIKIGTTEEYSAVELTSDGTLWYVAA